MRNNETAHCYENVSRCIDRYFFTGRKVQGYIISRCLFRGICAKDANKRREGSFREGHVFSTLAFETFPRPAKRRATRRPRDDASSRESTETFYRWVIDGWRKFEFSSKRARTKGENARDDAHTLRFI